LALFDLDNDNISFQDLEDPIHSFLDLKKDIAMMKTVLNERTLKEKSNSGPLKIEASKDHS